MSVAETIAKEPMNSSSAEDSRDCNPAPRMPRGGQVETLSGPSRELPRHAPGLQRKRDNATRQRDEPRPSPLFILWSANSSGSISKCRRGEVPPLNLAYVQLPSIENPAAATSWINCSKRRCLSPFPCKYEETNMLDPIGVPMMFAPSSSGHVLSLSGSKGSTLSLPSGMSCARSSVRGFLGVEYM
jgi:hypothetical protein